MGWSWVKTHQDPEARSFLKENASLDADAALLRIKKGSEWSKAYIKAQFEGKSRLQRKLPDLCKEGLIIPPKRAIEQASSQITAKRKAELYSGKLLIDLSMGMGADLFFLKQGFQKAIGYESNEDLAEINRFNFDLWGEVHVSIKNMDSVRGLDSLEGEADLIIVDPDRRNQKGRVFRFHDSSPNISGMIPDLLKRSKRVLVKSSPMLDIDYGIRELGKPSSIRILSVERECKEVLFEFGSEGNDLPKLFLDWHHKGVWNSVETNWKQPTESGAPYAGVRDFLYDPNPAFMKAQSFDMISERYSLSKISRNTHLFTSQELNPDFPGRKWRVIRSGEPGALNSIGSSANEILIRNYPLSKELILKKYKLDEGMDGSLFFFLDGEGKKKWALCEPI